MRNGFEIIDAHCHIYPEKIAAAASAHTGAFYHLPMCYDGTAKEMLREGDAGGIDRYLVQSVAVTPKQVPAIQRYIAGAVSASEGKFIGLGTLHPLSEHLESEFEDILARGLHGVKLHPDMQAFAIDDPAAMKIYELCQGRLPVLFHMGDERSDFSHPGRLRSVCRAFPGLTVIAAHLGGYTMWEEAAALLAGTKNLYTDCSSSFFALEDGTIRRIFRMYGAHRVLFGTDYPMWDAKTETDRFFSLGLSEEENRLILGENAKRVFGFR